MAASSDTNTADGVKTDSVHVGAKAWIHFAAVETFSGESVAIFHGAGRVSMLGMVQQQDDGNFVVGDSQGWVFTLSTDAEGNIFADGRHQEGQLVMPRCVVAILEDDVDAAVRSRTANTRAGSAPSLDAVFGKVPTHSTEQGAEGAAEVTPSPLDNNSDADDSDSGSSDELPSLESDDDDEMPPLQNVADSGSSDELPPLESDDDDSDYPTRETEFVWQSPERLVHLAHAMTTEDDATKGFEKAALASLREAGEAHDLAISAMHTFNKAKDCAVEMAFAAATHAAQRDKFAGALQQAPSLEIARRVGKATERCADLVRTVDALKFPTLDDDSDDDSDSDDDDSGAAGAAAAAAPAPAPAKVNRFVDFMNRDRRVICTLAGSQSRWIFEETRSTLGPNHVRVLSPAAVSHVYTLDGDIARPDCDSNPTFVIRRHGCTSFCPKATAMMKKYTTRKAIIDEAMRALSPPRMSEDVIRGVHRINTRSEGVLICVPRTHILGSLVAFMTKATGEILPGGDEDYIISFVHFTGIVAIYNSEKAKA